MKHLGFASITAVLQYIRYAEAQRLDTASAITYANIDTALLRNENGRIQGENFQALIEHFIGQSEDPLFGLHTSQQVLPSSYSILGYMVMSCSTIGEAIERIPPFERLVGDMGITTIDRIDDQIVLTWHCAYTLPKVRVQMIDNVLASWTQYARWLSNNADNASPSLVALERDLPPKAVISEFEAFFGCPVKFGQKKNAIVLPASLMSLSLRKPDQLLLKELENHALAQIEALEDPAQRMAIRVSNAIRKQLEMGSARKELIAAEFNMTERTLQRRLNDEGHSYQSLLDQVRKEQAIDMLEHSDLALQDIAYNLGFSDTRSFHRRFKHWTGKTPSNFRKSLLNAD